MHDSPAAQCLHSALIAAGPRRPLAAAGTVSALAARLAAEAGFNALWVSGLEVSAASGLPDANVLGSRDLAEVVAAVGRVAERPVIVDIDNAGGAVTTAERFAADLARAGAAAVCIEDSSYPKCNSFAAHKAQRLCEPELLCRQIERIRKTTGERLLVIARTEALISGADLATALSRAETYAAAGADAVLIHSKDATGRQALEIGRRWSGGLPLVCVPTAFPQLTLEELGRSGFRLCIYANQLSRAALAGMQAAVRQFAAAGAFRSTPAAPLAEVGELLRIGEPGALSCI